MDKGLKERILCATIRVFNYKGIKFTMDDIARELNISKKTIYTVFRTKDALFLDMVDFCFDRIKVGEQRVLNDDSMNTQQKLKSILAVLPDGYKDVDYRKLYILCDKYPDIYRKVKKRLETGWENTLYLLRKGIDEGVFRKFDINLFKMMFESSVARFFQNDILLENDIDYQEALNQVVEILVDGIVLHKEES